VCHLHIELLLEEFEGGRNDISQMHTAIFAFLEVGAKRLGVRSNDVFVDEDWLLVFSNKDLDHLMTKIPGCC
jgi:hypothetical protein